MCPLNAGRSYAIPKSTRTISEPSLSAETISILRETPLNQSASRSTSFCTANAPERKLSDLDLIATIALTVQPMPIIPTSSSDASRSTDTSSQPNSALLRPNHNAAERQRRESIRSAYDRLRHILAPLLGKRHLEGNELGRMSMVKEARDMIIQLENSIKELNSEIEYLRRAKQKRTENSSTHI